MLKWKVNAEESGQTLISFLKSKIGPETSSRKIKQAVDAGQCRINSKVERFSSKLVGKGDRIVFENIAETPRQTQTSQKISERILYADGDLIAYNKPPGIASDDKQLLDALQIQFGALVLLHRLDRDTTGVLLFARNEAMAASMQALFKHRQISKTYLAIVDGIPSHPSGVIENFLGKLHTYQGQTLWGAVPKEKGQSAMTEWNLQQAGSDAALVVCHPLTGRTHQIRVHMNGLGHPILGDHQYGRKFYCNYRASRMLLHASEIAFEHPMHKTRVVITAPIPDDFRGALKEVIEDQRKNK